MAPSPCQAPRPPVVAGHLSADRHRLSVACPFDCPEQFHEHHVQLGPFTAPCGKGQYRVVLSLDAAELPGDEDE